MLLLFNISLLAPFCKNLPEGREHSEKTLGAGQR